MSKVCAITGKGPLSGNKRSHSMRATRRNWNVNLQKFKVIVDGKPQTIRISARALKTLKNKEIFLFGTAGFGGDVSYFEKILTAVKENIDESNTVIGAYMCQGKMPMTVRARYEKMKQEANAMPNVDILIENFDKALTHPDADDLQKLRALVQNEK